MVDLPFFQFNEQNFLHVYQVTVVVESIQANSAQRRVLQEHQVRPPFMVNECLLREAFVEHLLDRVLERNVGGRTPQTQIQPQTAIGPV